MLPPPLPPPPPVAGFTVMVEVPVTDVLLTEVAVIVAVPAATAVTSPLAFTVATLVLLLDQGIQILS